MGFLDSIQSIISVYLLIAVGYILTKKEILSTEFGSRIAWLVVNLTFPAYILSALPYQFTKAQFMESAGGILVALIATAVLYPIGYVIGKLFKVKKENMGVFLALFVYSNVVFTGLPVNQALFGDSSVAYVLEYYIANTILFWTLGVYSLQKASGSGKGGINLKALLTPSLTATVVAIIFVLIGFKLPEMLQKPASMLGSMTSPLATLFIGMVFAEMKLSDFKITKDFWAVMIGRFIVSPFAVLLIMMFFTSFNADRQEVYILQAAMPAMNQVTILSKYYGCDYKYSTILTVWSFVVSMIALPLYVTSFHYLF